MNRSNYRFQASKYYFMIFKNNRLVAYTSEEREIKLYMRHRNRLQYEVRIYKFKDLPDIIKEKITSGDWEKELVIVGSYGQCCMTMEDEIKFVEYMSEFRVMTPEVVYKMHKMISHLKLSDKEQQKVSKLFKELYDFIDEMVICDNSDEEIFSFEACEKYLIKLGII